MVQINRAGAELFQLVSQVRSKRLDDAALMSLKELLLKLALNCHSVAEERFIESFNQTLAVCMGFADDDDEPFQDFIHRLRCIKSDYLDAEKKINMPEIIKEMRILDDTLVELNRADKCENISCMVIQDRIHNFINISVSDAERELLFDTLILLTAKAKESDNSGVASFVTDELRRIKKAHTV